MVHITVLPRQSFAPNSVREFFANVTKRILSDIMAKIHEIQ